MAVETFQVERAFEIDVVQAKDREPTRKRAGSPEIAPNVRLIEMGCQRGCHGTAQPLIEVAKDDSRPAQLATRHDPLVDESPYLPPLLKESRAEMHIENVERVAAELNVRSQASPRLSTAGTDVVIPVTLNRETGQHNIPIASALVHPVLTKSEMESERLGDEPRLIFLRCASFKTDDFLKSNDVRVELAENTDDAVGTHSSIHAAAFMNIVSSDSKNRAGLKHIPTTASQEADF
jgi:hypothetical protein